MTRHEWNEGQEPRYSAIAAIFGWTIVIGLIALFIYVAWGSPQ